MLDVFLTADVEIWCDGWKAIDRKFPRAFEKYIRGTTAKGDYGLPYQIDLFNEHGLKAVYFVETLFSTRFGSQPLAEIVSLLQNGHQEVQLHLHTEWADEARIPVLSNLKGKRQNLFDFSFEDQLTLIQTGKELLEQAGVSSVNAFRAGSFGFNRDTLRALAEAGIAFDTSYNATQYGPSSGVSPDTLLMEPIECEGIFEYPVSVYRDGTGGLRHAQLTACSFAEIESLLWQALEDERKAFVFLFHSFELLDPSKTRPDPIVVRRFRKLCTFLDRHRDVFRTQGFSDLVPATGATQPPPLQVTTWRTAIRLLEQAYRRTLP